MRESVIEKVGDSCPEYRMRWKALFLIGRNYENLKKTGLITESQANLKIKAAYEQLLEKYPDCEVAETAARSIGRTGAKRLQIREITK